MATEIFSFTYTASTSLYFAIFRLSDGKVLDFLDNTFKTLSGATTPYVSATELADLGGAMSGYKASVDLANVNSTSTAAQYVVDWYTNTGLTTRVSESDSIRVAASSIVTDSLTSTERNAIADAHLDRADGIETGVTPRQAERYQSAVLAGVVTGAGTGTEVFKAINNSGTTRVTVTDDVSGNRSAVSLS